MLVRSAMSSESLDISRLYAAEARRVWRMLRRLGVSEAAVEDAVQDVFLTAHQSLKRFEGRAQPSTWLLGIAVRVAANVRRSTQRRGVLGVGGPATEPEEAADEALQQQRDLRELEQVLSRLPDEQREVVVLMDLEQLPGPEVAEALGLKVNTVYSRLRLGRAALALALNGPERSAHE